MVTEEPDGRLFCVVDLHAITLPQNPEELRSNIYKMTASLIGCGLGMQKLSVYKYLIFPVAYLLSDTYCVHAI